MPDDLDVIRNLLHAQQLPQHIGRYEILDLLGQGGMGKVYRAYDPKLGRVVAIKLIDFTLEKSVQQKRILKEARATARLKHPNIVTMYEIGEDAQTCYLVMEYIAGVTLENYLENHTPSFTWCLDILQKIALAMHYAHKEGIIHRDLKPANIMIVDEQQPKIMDFGLAKCVDEGPSSSSQGKMIGTIYYMAPEQVTAQGNIDKRADIYAIGSILYEMLTHQKTVTGSTSLEIALSILQQPPIRPRQINFRIPPDVELICLKCLQKKPQARYANALLLAQDIQRYMDCKAISVQQKLTWAATKRWVNEHLYLFILCGLLLLLLCLNIYFYDRIYPATPSVLAKESQKSNPPNTRTFSESKEVQDCVALMLNSIWENLATQYEFSIVQNRLASLLAIAPNYLTLHQESGKIWMVAGMRAPRESQPKFFENALASFDKAMELSRITDWYSCFLAYQICEYYPGSYSNKKYNYVKILSQELEFQLYFKLYENLNKIQMAALSFEEAEIYQRECMEQAILSTQEYPQSPWLYFVLAKCYYSIGKYENALQSSSNGMEAYEKFLKGYKQTIQIISPWYLELLLLQARTYVDTKQNEKAEILFKQLLSASQDHVLANFYQGEYHLQNRALESAIQDFSKVVQLNPSCWDAYAYRGQAYLQSKQYQAAYSDTNLLIKQYPNKAEYYIQRACISHAVHNDRALVEDIEIARRINPNHPKLLALIRALNEKK